MEKPKKPYMIRVKKRDENWIREKLKGSPYYLKRTSKNGVVSQMCYFLLSTNNSTRRLCTPNESVRLLIILGLRTPKNAKDRGFQKAFEKGLTVYNKQLFTNQ